MDVNTQQGGSRTPQLIMAFAAGLVLPLIVAYIADLVRERRPKHRHSTDDCGVDGCNGP